ncbi:MAG: SAM-dependent DNA methyltransferase [Brevinematales bacterium]|nr:SAM-dependent DNA methyltransferase [Brevinematales bacterium]
MSPLIHSEMVKFIWEICNLLRGPYKRNEYRKVILPLTVLRRFDCILESTKKEVLKEYEKLKGKSEPIILAQLGSITGVSFYNVSKLNFRDLLNDPNQIAPNLNSYINAFSSNVRQIFERFDFGVQVDKMNEKNLLYKVIQAFSIKDLSPEAIDNVQMGYVFEELIRIGAELSNEEAGEHFTPREVIKLMVNLLLAFEGDLSKSHVVKTIYDPACGTGGMLSVSESYIRTLNADAKPFLYGQDLNDEAYAICKADMLIKGEESENIRLGDTFLKDGFPKDKFDYMLANPPFGVEWKQQEKTIKDEHKTLGFEGRFGPGLPRINDGSLLFLMHMISKMQPLEKGGSRIGIVFNGSPLFTGDAGSGESEIRKWIIENDWLEAVAAMPDQLFYNTGISTYIWIITNRKEEHRKGKVQLIDGREFYEKMRKSLGNKRRQIGHDEIIQGNPIIEKNEMIDKLTVIHGDFIHNDTRMLSDIRALENGEADKRITVSKIFDNADFGYSKITVERPLRLNFRADAERIKRLQYQKAFREIAEEPLGEERRLEILTMLDEFGKETGRKLYKERAVFIEELEEYIKKKEVFLTSAEKKAVHDALKEKDETAEICRDSRGDPEPDPDLRDTENVPLREDIAEYFAREVLPHVPDAWIDEDKTKVGYELPFNRHFYVYEPPRPLETIEAEIRALETEIVALLAEVTGSGEGVK